MDDIIFWIGSLFNSAFLTGLFSRSDYLSAAGAMLER
jgi:hypothetical protein